MDTLSPDPSLIMFAGLNIRLNEYAKMTHDNILAKCENNEML